MQRHTMASCATTSKTATTRVVLNGILAINFQSPTVGGLTGFMDGLTRVPFGRGVHKVLRRGSVALSYLVCPT